MSNLSFHEKSALGTLIALLGVGAVHFHAVWKLWQADALQPASMTGLALGLSVLLVVILVGYHIAIAAIREPEVEDERDRLVAWRAGNVGGTVLGVAVIGIVVQILVGGVFGQSFAESPMLIANALIAAVLVAAAIELILTLVFYRRGI